MMGAEASGIRLAIFLAGLVFFLAFELVRPYRRPSVSKVKRWIDNLALTAVNSLILNLILANSVAAVAVYATSRQVGVFNLLGVTGWVKLLATVAFMDFILYVWHLLNHEVPFLWRFHRVHHADLNMDVSTATRFHLGELLISAVIKISLVYFIGADPLGVIVFESALVLSAQFHHSSLRIPAGMDRAWLTLFVSPDMHRIHHSVKIKERNTNYGTIFSFWDRFMGTYLAGIDQARIRIGVGAYPRPDKVGFLRLLVMPFTRPVL